MLVVLVVVIMMMLLLLLLPLKWMLMTWMSGRVFRVQNILRWTLEQNKAGNNSE